MRWHKVQLAWLAVAFISTPLIAAGITVLEPGVNGDNKIAEGVEFGAYVIGNRWDMSESTDVITTESMSLTGESFINGVYRANSVQDGSPQGLSDARFFLTYPGLSSAVTSIESGQKYPIDTSHYRYVTIKIRHLDLSGLPTNSKHTVQIFFFEDENSIRDGTFGFTLSSLVMSDGDWHIVKIDLHDDLSPSSSHAWTDFNAVKGFRIDPTGFADTRIEIDWVRLTAPGDVSTSFEVQWTGGFGPFEVTAQKQDDVAVVMASGITDYFVDVDFSGLPEGEYSIEVADQQETGISVSKLKINQAPLFIFLQPDILGAVEQRYSLVEIGNPWGPMDPADVSSTNRLASISYTSPNGSLSATTLGSDSQVVFNTPVPIDSIKYRMLSFTTSVSGAREIGLGSVARVFWGQHPAELSTSEDIVVQEGLNTYALGDMQALPVEGGAVNQWLGSVVAFRFDPVEFASARIIRIDSVVLAPLDTADPTFSIEWMDSDEDDNASIKLYADVDKAPGNGNEVLIASGIAEDGGPDSFFWTATDLLSEGEHYLYAQIDDGYNQTTRYATGPIMVRPTEMPNPDIGFYDGFED